MVPVEGSITAEKARAAFMSGWVAHYGLPLMLVCDQGPEFTGAVFAQDVGQQGVLLHYTDAKSPWQAGRTERAGGIFKLKLDAVIADANVQNHDDYVSAVHAVVAARNRLMDRSGFSPDQRWFGNSLRLPNTLLSTDAIDMITLEETPNEQVLRQWELREAAMTAWVRSQDNEAFKKAVHARPRLGLDKPLAAGTWVKVWRNHMGFTGWVGPGVILSESPHGRSYWISMRGSIWKVSRERIREATAE